MLCNANYQSEQQEVITAPIAQALEKEIGDGCTERRWEREAQSDPRHLQEPSHCHLKRECKRGNTSPANGANKKESERQREEADEYRPELHRQVTHPGQRRHQRDEIELHCLTAGIPGEEDPVLTVEHILYVKKLLSVIAGHLAGHLSNPPGENESSCNKK